MHIRPTKLIEYMFGTVSWYSNHQNKHKSREFAVSSTTKIQTQNKIGIGNRLPIFFRSRSKSQKNLQTLNPGSFRGRKKADWLDFGCMYVRFFFFFLPTPRAIHTPDFPSQSHKTIDARPEARNYQAKHGLLAGCRCVDFYK